MRLLRGRSALVGGSVILVALSLSGCVKAVQTDWRPPIIDGNPDPVQFGIDFERCKDFATVATAEDPLKWGELFAATITGALAGAAGGAAGGAVIGGGDGARIGAAAGSAGGAVGRGVGISAYAREEHRRRRMQATEYCLKKVGYEVVAY